MIARPFVRTQTMNTITRSARTDSRLVCGGSRNLRHLARLAHRANRRAARVACRLARLTGDTTHTDSHHVTGWDVS